MFPYCLIFLYTFLFLKIHISRPFEGTTRAPIHGTASRAACSWTRATTPSRTASSRSGTSDARRQRAKKWREPERFITPKHDELITSWCTSDIFWRNNCSRTFHFFKTSENFQKDSINPLNPWISVKLIKSWGKSATISEKHETFSSKKHQTQKQE